MVHQSPWYRTVEPPIGVHWAMISTNVQIAEKIKAHHNLYSFRHYLIIGPTLRPDVTSGTYSYSLGYNSRVFRQRFSKYIIYPFKLISNCIEKYGSSDPTESGSSVPDTILIMLSQSTVEPCGRCIITIFWSQYNLHANNTDTYIIYNTCIT